MDESMYKTMYPTSFMPPKFHGLLKIHKTGIPLRPIVSSRGSVTYGVAKVLTKVLKPLVGLILPSHTKYQWLCKQGQRGYPPTRRVPHIIQCHCTFYFHSNRSQLLILLKIYWKKMANCRTEQYYQCRTSLNFWGSVCIIHSTLPITKSLLMKNHL